MSNFDHAIDAMLGELREIEIGLERLEAERSEIRDALRQALIETETSSVTRPKGRVALATNRATVRVIDHGALPKTFLRTEPDKGAILKALRDGQIVPGAEIVENEEMHVRVTWSE